MLRFHTKYFNIIQINTLLADLDTPIHKLNEADGRKSMGALISVIWNQTAPLFMRQHIRKTILASIILFITFFTAHGVYMWFPHILNSVNLYVENSHKEPKCLCDILRFTQSSNFSVRESSIEVFRVINTIVL